MPIIMLALVLAILLLPGHGPAQAQTGDETRKDYVSQKKEETQPPAESLSDPVLNDQAIALWADTIVPDIFNFTYENYQTALDESKRHFTQKGFSSFMKALYKAQILEMMKANKLTVSTAAGGIPRICRQNEENGVYLWRVEIPKTIVYTAPDNKQNMTPLYINLDIVRTAEPQAAEKIAIERWFALTPDMHRGPCEFAKDSEIRAMLDILPTDTKYAMEHILKLEEENKALKNKIETLTGKTP